MAVITILYPSSCSQLVTSASMSSTAASRRPVLQPNYYKLAPAPAAHVAGSGRRVIGYPALGTTLTNNSNYSNRVLVRANYPSPGSADIALQRLGLHRGASQQDIKQAYRKLALQFHPDVCKGDSCFANFIQIKNAYEVVMKCLQGNIVGDDEPLVRETSNMMDVYEEEREEWEEWMGWEGAGTLDFSNPIDYSIS